MLSKTRLGIALLATASMLLLMGCYGNYRLPAAGASLASMFEFDEEFIRDAKTDPQVRSAWNREPLAKFPTRIATVRVAPAHSFQRSGRYASNLVTPITLRDIDAPEQLARIASFEAVAQVLHLNRLVIDTGIVDEEGLRRAAGSVQADMLFVYTFDTRFHTEDGALAPLAVVSLGIFPNKTAKCVVTCSGALVDTRTGFVYALLEATHETSQLANAWTSKDAVDQSRRRAERIAFEGLIDDFKAQWPTVLISHAPPHSAIRPVTHTP